MSQGTTRFFLDQGDQQAGDALEYRPFGMRCLKIEISTAADLPPLTLRPEGAAGGNGHIYTLAGPNHEFQISWGGGHDDGPPAATKDTAGAFEESVPLAGGGKPTFLYFNVRHLGDDLPDQTPLTIQALRQDGTQQASLTVQLKKPAAYADDVLRLIPDPNQSGRWIRSAGQRLANYDSRWWPSDTTGYSPVPPLPLSVERDDKTLCVQWAGHKTVVTIRDLSSPTVLDVENGPSFELFHFDDHHIVLRAAFYWLDKSMGHKLFLVRHEVPDVERFDFILSKQDGRAILACTDLHWQEHWGQLMDPAAPIAATIGLDFKAKIGLLGHGASKLFGHKEDTRPRYNPIGFIHRLAGRLAAGDEVIVKRAKGLEAHVPTLNNVGTAAIDDEQRLIIVTKKTNTVPEMTSTDVRKG